MNLFRKRSQTITSFHILFHVQSGINLKPNEKHITESMLIFEKTLNE